MTPKTLQDLLLEYRKIIKSMTMLMLSETEPSEEAQELMLDMLEEHGFIDTNDKFKALVLTDEEDLTKV